MDEKGFGWICDADVRLGPVIEAVINGRYYWVPFARLKRLVIEAPADLRDVVWTPAHFEFHNGGESVALIPTRYPGSETSSDDSVVLARKTVWQEVAPGVFEGQGQRMLATDAGEHSLMDVRSIVMDEPRPGA
jgi:type VI secretion system protein ImpE